MSETRMSLFDAVMVIEDGLHGEEETLKAWAHLIKTGQCWTLQGWYGRAAASLIERGVISKDGEVLDQETEA